MVLNKKIKPHKIALFFPEVLQLREFIGSIQGGAYFTIIMHCTEYE